MERFGACDLHESRFFLEPSLRLLSRRRMGIPQRSHVNVPILKRKDSPKYQKIVPLPDEQGMSFFFSRRLISPRWRLQMYMAVFRHFKRRYE